MTVSRRLRALSAPDPADGCRLLTSSFPPVPQHSIRALALRVLREILRNQPARFKNYAELTIMKTLEAHKDSHKEVSRPKPGMRKQVRARWAVGRGLSVTARLPKRSPPRERRPSRSQG